MKNENNSALSALIAVFHAQSRSCAAMGSPFMARLMTELAALWPGMTGPLAEKMAGFEGDLGPRGQSLPLRLAGGLHALVRTGRAPDLAAAYPPKGAGDLRAGLVAVLAAQERFLCDWVESPPQTNETGRSAVLIAAAAEVVSNCGLPLHLSELGASAGLNLLFDRYALDIGLERWGAADSPLALRPDWRGALPRPAVIRVAARRGVDLTPLDPAHHGARMLAYLWPDQPERIARMETALTIAAKAGPLVDQGDAAEWLEARLTQGWEGACHLVYHTVAHQYFPAAAQIRIARAMEVAGARATASAPLAWVGMEVDAKADGAGVTLRLWPGDLRLSLGRAGFHGQWVDWQPERLA